jgi:hypothetical protein
MACIQMTATHLWLVRDHLFDSKCHWVQACFEQVRQRIDGAPRDARIESIDRSEYHGINVDGSGNKNIGLTKAT